MFKNSIGVVASLVVMAAILPMALVGLMSPGGFSLNSRADSAKQLNVWLEPAEVVARPGKAFRLQVVAELNNKNTIVPQLSGWVTADKGLNVSNTAINYSKPFSGKVVLGELTVTTTSEGKYEVHVEESSISTGIPDLNVKTGKTAILSKF